ncbi:hypothetical protein V8B97DRAFT_1918478 [Scleroderma yunnanense]
MTAGLRVGVLVESNRIISCPFGEVDFGVRSGVIDESDPFRILAPALSNRNSQLEGGNWTEYNYVCHWTENHMFAAGTRPVGFPHLKHVPPLEVPSRYHWATVNQGTLVVPSPSSNAQGHPSQFINRPPNVDASQVTDSSPGEGTFECRWLQKGEEGPCGQVFSHRKEVVKHLNYAHGVGGGSRRDITCRWLPHYASSFRVMSTFTFITLFHAPIPVAKNLIPARTRSRST